MTDSQKIEALTELLGNVINTLELTQYDIDDAHESYEVVKKADSYHAQMINILHGGPVEEPAQAP
jgi:hypothetical protein